MLEPTWQVSGLGDGSVHCSVCRRWRPAPEQHSLRDCLSNLTWAENASDNALWLQQQEEERLRSLLARVTMEVREGGDAAKALQGVEVALEEDGMPYVTRLPWEPA